MLTGLHALPWAVTAGDRVRASPYARKVAAEAGVSLAGLAGSGPGGRVVAEDVRAAVASGRVGAQGAYGRSGCIASTALMTAHSLHALPCLACGHLIPTPTTAIPTGKCGWGTRGRRGGGPPRL